MSISRMSQAGDRRSSITIPAIAIPAIAIPATTPTTAKRGRIEVVNRTAISALLQKAGLDH
jgi:hypothetical protein